MSPEQGLRELSDSICSAQVRAISDIQGSENRSPLTGSSVLTRGVVTRVMEDSGVFFEQALADLDPATSDGLFAAEAALGGLLKPGDEVVFRGRVSEIGNDRASLTALEPVSGYRVCASNHPLPDHVTGLPLTDNEQEALEGMRISIQQQLVLVDVWGLLTGNQLGIAKGDVLWTPTEIHPPGPAAGQLALDNRQRALHLSAVKPLVPSTSRAGDHVFQVGGILAQDEFGYHLVLASYIADRSEQKIPILPEPAGLRLAGFNLHNYFNGDGKGGGFPTSRGASSSAEFQQQTSRLLAAINEISPDILALSELENDGYGPHSAVAGLVEHLNQGLDTAPWRFSQAEQAMPEEAAIAVGIVYRNDRVRAVGPAHTLTGPSFSGLSRQPLAQLFKVLDGGQQILVSANHLKSKGSCPDDGPNANQGDGQGCWNPVRTESALAIDQWLKALGKQLDSNAILILGDFNAYRQEQPIHAFREAGWAELVESKQTKGRPFSFIYRGQRGSLDYAFASQALLPWVANARIWNINSMYPPGLDAGYKGSSDHDPVIVDLEFSSAAANP